MKNIVERLVDNNTGLRGALNSYALDEIYTHCEDYVDSLVDNLEEDHPEISSLSNEEIRQAIPISNVSAKDVLALQDKVIQLENLLSQLKTNVDVDWIIEDANWEFMALSETLEQILNSSEDCESFTSVGECSSIDNGRWHNETLQELGDDYYVHCDWDIQENGVAIDCYGKELEPEDDGGGYTYLWLHGAGWTDRLVREVIDLELYEDHSVYLLDGFVLCGDWVYRVFADGFLDMENGCLLSECIFDYPDCEDSVVDILCEGGE